jgi:hypothetical protein
MTKEMSRPILFSAPMVRALLEGRKTQTRRQVKYRVTGPNRPNTLDFHEGSRWRGALDARSLTGNALALCPYGKPGDLLWVRETCRAHELTDKEAEEDTFGVMERLGLEYPLYGLDGVIYAADGTFREIQNTQQASQAWCELNHYRGKQGATVPPIHMPRWASRITLRITSVRVERVQAISQADCIAEGIAAQTGPFVHHVVADYRRLWGEINGKESWDANPWVWVVAFERAEAMRAAA